MKQAGEGKWVAAATHFPSPAAHLRIAAEASEADFTVHRVANGWAIPGRTRTVLRPTDVGEN